MATTPIILPEPGLASERSDFWKGLGIAVLAAAVMFIAVVGLLTLLGVSNTTTATNTNTVQIKRIADGLATGNKTVSAILTEAGQAVVKVWASQGRIEHNEYEVCLAVHATGCTPPP